MLFNSIEYVLFLPIVFLLYWFVFNRQLVQRNAFLIAISYLFYGWWDWRFLLLIIISSAADFMIGRAMGATEKEKERKPLLIASLVINLSILGFFKYFGFFVDSFAEVIRFLGMEPNLFTLKIILPVGISFYTFQTLSYTIDIYRRKMAPTQDPFAFFAFVSFFPQLVAGPIERAKNLLPQFNNLKEFDEKSAKDGMRQILWGFFKKIVIADQCAPHVNYIFDNYETLPSGMLVLGAVYFAFQIYGDFSGYSDIAIGTARLFGYNLMQNFNFPYLSRDVAEFWRRWHISLSSWFRDYIYIPLGGNRDGKLGRIRNIIITFTISGFWHGANWTFIFWGFLNGLYYIPLMLMGKNKSNTDVIAKDSFLPPLREVMLVGLTFALTVLTWIFFRADNISQAFSFLGRIFSLESGTIPRARIIPAIWIIFFFIIEYFSRRLKHPFENFDGVPMVVRWSVYVFFVLCIFKSYAIAQTFIYFQF